VSPMPACKPYHRILIPSDLQPESRRGFVTGLAFALRTRGTVTLVNMAPSDVVPPDWSAIPNTRALLERWKVVREEATIRDFDALGLHVELMRKQGDDVAHISDHVPGVLPSLLVLATHGRTGLRRLRHGSIAEKIARYDTCPALFLPEGATALVDEDTGEIHLNRVLVPLSNDTDPQVALASLVELWDAVGSGSLEVTLLHVGRREDIPDVPLPQKHGWIYRSEVVPRGQIAASIVAAAEEFSSDLIIMATHGHDSVVDAVAGSITERVVRSSPAPVLASPIGDYFKD
jgi:nucleotide-binding universal stress UspA family protein